MTVKYAALIGSDSTLLTLLLSANTVENDKGWEHLYASCYPGVKDFITRNQGSSDDAVDFFQEGMLIFYKNVRNGVFREESAISTYVFGICRNLWLKELQRRGKHSAFLEEFGSFVQAEDVSYAIRVEIITLLMSELKEECRRMLSEYYYNKKSMLELKDMFNVNSIQAAKNKKLRCMKYLHRLCIDRGLIKNVGLINDHE